VTYEPVIQGYLLLGLRLGRLIDGFVDCWFGDPALSRQVADEPTASPAELVGQADRLLAEIPDTGLAADRQRFLTAQLTALRTVARRLTGEQIPFRAEVADYFQVDISMGDPEYYASVHDAIAELLPGPGDLPSRVAAYSERNHVPARRLRRCTELVSERLRELTVARYGLPATEHVDYQVAHDKPWNAFNHYHGAFQSTVTLNAEAGHAIGALPVLVAHESYPGHHTERCVKEAELAGRGYPEHAIYLVNTPQCLVTEGAGELAVTAALGPGWGEWTAEILAAAGVHLDGELTERLLTLVRELLPARQDAAILLHDGGADADAAAEYLGRWLLLPEDRAGHMVRFLTDPLWRAYTVTYIEGARLVSDWLAARPSGVSVGERYGTLLREPMLPATMRADMSVVDSRG
jgi:hypothetical protein